VEIALALHVNVDKPTENMEYSFSRGTAQHLKRTKTGESAVSGAQSG
jgi:hypothetical protein